MNIYETCPVVESERFLLRLVTEQDCADLLKVYSDLAAVPLVNSDNCVNDFYITTEEGMRDTIAFWLREYAMRYYVRWSIVDRAFDCAIGTIELFHRSASDFYDNVGLLRLDLRSDYENEAEISQILSLILPPSFEWFYCDRIATKAKPIAQKRIKVLTEMGFEPTDEPLIGHDGTKYWDYFVKRK